MTDDQQRARQLPIVARLYERQTSRCTYRRASVTRADGEPLVRLADAQEAITAALRAAPEVGDSYVVLQRVDVKRLLAGDENSPGYELSRRRIAACLDLHDQNGLAVVANGPQVVPPPTLGAHEVHPEAVDVGLDLGESGESLLAADALEHAASVSTECDGSATASGWQPIDTAPEGRLVVVGWLDAEDSHYPENYEFDYLEDGLWAKHEDCVEHAHAVAPPGSQMPKEQPPYQWWMDLPAFPAARPQGV